MGEDQVGPGAAREESAGRGARSRRDLRPRAAYSEEAWGREAEGLARAQAESSGLLSMVGFTALAMAAPMATRRAGASVAKTLAGGSAPARAARRGVRGVARRGGVVERAGQAVAREGRDLASGAAERVSFSRVAERAGYTGPSRIKRRGEAWRKYKETAEGGALRSFLGESGARQRRLMSSAVNDQIREQAMVFPAAYAVDTQLGITQEPQEEIGNFDVAGHAERVANYLPEYAAYEAAGLAGFGVAGTALKSGVRAAKSFMQGNMGLARAGSAIYQTLEEASGLQSDVSDAARRAYQDGVGGATLDGKLQGAQAAAGKAARAARRSSRKRSERVKSAWRGVVGTAGSMEVPMDDMQFAGAWNAFAGRSGGGRKNILDLLENEASVSGGARQDQIGPEQVAQNIGARLFGQGDEVESGMGRVLGARAVRLGEAREAGVVSRSAADRLREQLEDVQRQVGSDSTGQNFSEAVQDQVGSWDIDQLKMSGLGKMDDGRIYRMPSRGDVRASFFGGAANASTVNTGLGSFSLSRVMGAGPGEGGAASIQWMDGSLSLNTRRLEVNDRARKRLGPEGVQKYRDSVTEGAGSPFVSGEGSDELFSFGRSADTNAARRNRDFSSSGLFIANQAGRRTGSVTARRGSDIFQSAANTRYMTGSGVRSIAQERAVRLARQSRAREGTGGASQERIDARRRGEQPEGGFFDALRQFVGIPRKGGIHQARRAFESLAGKRSPRQVLGEQSDLWDTPLSAQQPEGSVFGDAVTALRQSLDNSAEGAFNANVMQSALNQLDKNGALRKQVGTAQEIMQSDQKAREAARYFVDELDAVQSRSRSRAPSRSKAETYLKEAAGNPRATRNATGRRRANVFRQMLVEEAVMQKPTGDKVLGDLRAEIGKLENVGQLTPKAAAEARAGATFMEMAREGLPGRFHGASSGANSLLDVEGAQEARQIMMRRRSELEEFAASRPRVDTGYHRRNYWGERSQGGAAASAEGIGVRSGSAGESFRGLGSMRAERLGAGLRRVLSEVGLGWERSLSTGTAEGAKTVGKYMGRRAALFAGGVLGWRALDYASDVMIPDSAGPAGEGLTSAGGAIAASMTMAASRIRDATGITGAAQYMEGLLPESTSTVPGALAGAYLGGPVGAVVGASFNQIAATSLEDTPFEALGLVPGLGAFTTDLTETAEETRAQLEGRDWIAQRSGRMFFLSSTPFSGGRIESYRPSWYARMRSDYQASDSLYGSEFEQMLFKDLPLIDFAPGDLLNPSYIEQKQRAARPYQSPDIPFSDVPIIGPYLGRNVGEAFLSVHPMASNPNKAPTYIGAGMTGEPTAGGYGALQRGSGVGGPFPGAEGGYALGASHPSTVADEQFYRLSEAIGFQGFLGQTAAGGEGIFRRARTTNAANMDSTGRFLEDAAIGDAMGLGEALRRLYPYSRGGPVAQGPENRAAQWLPERFQRGDPFCLLPKTLVDTREHGLLEAERLHERIRGGETVHVKTHRGRWRPVVASASREVDEEVYSLKTEGAPWRLGVTGEHPVLVVQEDEELTDTNLSIDWKLTGDVGEGDRLVTPIEKKDEYIETMVWSDNSKRIVRHLSGTLVSGLLALFGAEPSSDPRRWSVRGLDAAERLRVNEGFGMEGSKYATRHGKEISVLRRELHDQGLPYDIIGAPLDSVRQILLKWGRIFSMGKEMRLGHFNLFPVRTMTDDYRGKDAPARIEVEFGPEELGRVPREDWPQRTNYESDRTDEEQARQTAWHLQQALEHLKTMPDIEQLPEGRWRFTLTGRDAVGFVASTWARDAESNRRSVRSEVVQAYYDAGRASASRVSNDHCYATYRAVEKAESFHYSGPVYAFEVEGDESFVAGGVATHNSKVKMGEALLPGEGFERQGVATGAPLLDVEDYRTSEAGTALAMAGATPGSPRRPEGEAQSRAKKMMAQRLRDMEIAVREKATYVDEEKRLVAQADMATKSNQPIQIQAVDDISSVATAARDGDRARMNLALGAGGQSRGLLAYVETSTGRMRIHSQNFDREAYNRQSRQMQQQVGTAQALSEIGYGREGAMYGPTERLRVLMNADPFSDEYSHTEDALKSLSAAGVLTPQEERSFRQTQDMQSRMGMSFESYPRRFRMDQLLNPSDTYASELNFNDDIQAASNYSLPERVIAGGYEAATSLRTPLHTKLFGQYTPAEQYERRVLLSRDFQSWDQPVEDFAKPWAAGLREVDNPVQGSLSFGLGGYVFGGPVMGAASAAYGAAQGTVRGAMEMTGVMGQSVTPGRVEQMRRVERGAGRLQYARAQALEAAGLGDYSSERRATAIGWAQEGLTGEGWAKTRQSMDRPPGEIPPELYTAWKAAPGSERDYLNAAFKMQDETARKELLGLVSPEMSAVMEVGWSYLDQGDIDPHLASRISQETRRLSGGAVSSDPAMGPGRSATERKIRTIEDLRLDAHDAGVGWKTQDLRQSGALAQPATGIPGSMIDGGSAQGPARVGSPEEVRMMIQGALAQMGIQGARVEVNPTNGPSTVNYTQS